MNIKFLIQKFLKKEGIMSECNIKVILELSKKYEGHDITILKIPSTSYCFY